MTRAKTAILYLRIRDDTFRFFSSHGQLYCTAERRPEKIEKCCRGCGDAGYPFSLFSLRRAVGGRSEVKSGAWRPFLLLATNVGVASRRSIARDRPISDIDLNSTENHPEHICRGPRPALAASEPLCSTAALPAHGPLPSPARASGWPAAPMQLFWLCSSPPSHPSPCSLAGDSAL